MSRYSDDCEGCFCVEVCVAKMLDRIKENQLRHDREKREQERWEEEQADPSYPYNKFLDDEEDRY